MGAVLGIALGIATILLGAKGFTKEGIPLTNTKRLTGAGGKTIGLICFFLGFVFIVLSLYGALPRGR